MTERYIEKDGKRLRLGYSTGSCAAAAAKGAAILLLTGRRPEAVELDTPAGVRLTLPLHNLRLGEGSAACGVVKDAGDDPDVTNGAMICAEVFRTETPGITVEGGPGVGRVTKPGLDRPVGAAAINSVPLGMIGENLAAVLRASGASGGLRAVISVPGGEALAAKTFNPRLGIVGGISILGTSGLVEPMSEDALLETIQVELRQRRASGEDLALLVPGQYGADFLRDSLRLDPGRGILCSNFLGEAVRCCGTLGFSSLLLVGHAGKLVKLAGGIANTHSRYGDCRMELIAAHAAAEGLPPDGVRKLLDCAAVDAAIPLLDAHGLREAVFSRLTERAAFYLRAWAGDNTETGLLMFSRVCGILGQTSNVPALLDRLRPRGGTPPKTE